MKQLKQIHAYSLRNAIDQNKFLIVKFLDIPNIPYAHQLFDQIPNPAVFLYNKLIQAYASQNQTSECFNLYSLMRFNAYPPPNELTFTFLFPSCVSSSSSSSSLGTMLHTHFLKLGFGANVFAMTALVDMYAKSGRIHSARKVFDEAVSRDVPTWNSLIAGYARLGNVERAMELFERMPSRSVVSWTAMVSGYSQNGRYMEALAMFFRMEEEGVRPNEVTLASVLPACANLGALEVGKRIEEYARKNGTFGNPFVSNAVLELYARCGKIDTAWQVFNEIGSRRNLCSWNSMIMGLAVHGRCSEVLELYDHMLNGGIEPDDVTFVGLLLACTHGGMVSLGRKLFKSMETKHGISPKLEHYGCMVDLLGRAGNLQEAYNLVCCMPMKPDSVVWGALLGACSFHGNVEFAEKAVKSLIELEPRNPGNYVILSNIYASTGRWDEVAQLRKSMKGGQITKAAGYSFIEEGGTMHKFLVEDRSHMRSDEIYAVLDELYSTMKLQKKASNWEDGLHDFELFFH